MAGIKALRIIQLGKEATPGLAVAATTKWRGMGTIEDQRQTVFPQENIGYLSGVDRSYVPSLGGAIAFDPIEATFEQIVHVLEAGVKLVQTGADDGAGSGKIYNYILPVTGANTTRTYTIEGGDNEAVEEMEYCYVTEFSLSGEAGAAMMMSSTWEGRQVVPTTVTAAVPLPPVEEIFFSKAILTADLVDGTLGATPQSNTVLAAELKVVTGIQKVPTASGALYFSFTKNIGPEVTLSVTYDHDTTSVAEKVLWRAQTPRQIRLKILGKALTEAGTTHTYKTLQIDLAGKWESFGKVDEKDGNDILQGVFRAKYNETAALFAEILVVNELASVP